VAGGARLALSREFSADVFWEETRRYGATVVSYTWTMLREVVDAPADRREPHHSIRLFIGSGMPAGLWKRVGRRFRRARVVEFYAPIDGEAVLANVSSHKPGAIGRPLPGSSAIRIGAYDIEAGRFVYGADGLVRECAPGEVGMLLVEVHPAEAVADVPMRGVFRSGDAWRATGDLFWKDRDGDHWLAGPASTVIRAQAGLVFPSLVDDALLALGEVDLAVTYAVTRQGRPPLVVSAVQLRDEAAPPTQEDLTDTFASLARGSPPDAVRVVAAIPLTAWYRPNAGALASEGLDFGGPAWWRNPDGQYEPLTIDAAEKLLGQ
jgi:putative long chain acyl-CoA synthase